MNLAQATRLASFLKAQLEPHCQPGSVAIAGSIRREKPEGIKDVELLALPLWVPADSSGQNLFEDVQVSALHRWATSDKTRRVIRWVKTGIGKLEEGNLLDTVPDPGGRYWRGVVTTGWKEPEQAMLDLFIPHPDGYGAQMLIRTGSAEFSAAVMGHAHKVGHRFDGGVIIDSAGEVVPCASEREVFELLKLAYVEPFERTGKHAVRPLR